MLGPATMDISSASNQHKVYLGGVKVLHSHANICQMVVSIGEDPNSHGKPLKLCAP